MTDAEALRIAQDARSRMGLPSQPSGLADALSEIVALGRRAKAAAEARMGVAVDVPDHPCTRCVAVHEATRGRTPIAQAESYTVEVDRTRVARRWTSRCRECADIEWSDRWEARRQAAAGDHEALLALEREKQDRIARGRWIQPVRRR